MMHDYYLDTASFISLTMPELSESDQRPQDKLG